MGIGAGTGVAGSSVPPQIRDTQTTAYVETNKVALAIVPADTYEVIPFTQQDSNTYRKYDTMPNKPLLTEHMMQMRLSNLEREGDDKSWKPIYDDLVTKLPTTTKNLLTAENNKPFLSRELNFVVLNNVLESTAKMISWIGNAIVPPAPDSPAGIQNTINTHLSSIALRGAVSSFGAVLSDAQSQLEGLGANFIGHDHVSNVLNQLQKLLPVFGLLSKKEAAGEDVKQPFILLADATHRLAELNKKEGSTEQFNILGAVLSTLDTIASSRALENASPSLLIGTHMANFDNGGALSTISNKLVDGLLDSMSSGLRDQLGELDDLQSDLRALRNG